ncbi:hypothetical protein [Falsiroseomonas sp. E2-1-a4]|uniref:hypothetical protein n=1 Tax=Falsiroseomonas sp. E2-1-a4 TaxID=3239299 RepID=UPI003F32B7C3
MFVALHLPRHCFEVAVLDRQRPGGRASFGNSGNIGAEAVFPTPFPRALTYLLRIVRNHAIDVS